jgi:hypothetical protein
VVQEVACSSEKLAQNDLIPLAVIVLVKRWLIDWESKVAEFQKRDWKTVPERTPYPTEQKALVKQAWKA